MYADGVGVAKDDAQAARWFAKAADQGHGAAHYALGELYRLGRGVGQDNAEALRRYQQAAALGNPNAQHILGLFYEGRNAILWPSREPAP